LETLRNRSEILRKVLNVVLGKDVEDQLDQSCEKWPSVTNSQGEKEQHASNKVKKG